MINLFAKNYLTFEIKTIFYDNVIKIKKYSGEWFRSTDLWVMSPARFLCATPLSVIRILKQFILKPDDKHNTGV